MDKTLNYILKFQSNADKVSASVDRINSSVDKVGNGVNSLRNKFSAAMDSINKKLNTIRIDSIVNNISHVADGLDAMNEPGLKLGSSLSDLSAITDVAGSKLKEIEGYARQSAKTFGGSAASGVEAYKLILSQLTPEIAKAPKALQAMGKNVSILSKTMGGDTTAATEVLTTAMNQYQVSTKDPLKASEEMADMMNIMAAAAKEGSAELPEQKSALEQSGMAAKAANVAFAEHAAAIQVLDKAGKKGSEGGVALRNTLATLSQGRFLPKDVQKELQDAGVNIADLTDKNKTLADRLKPLRNIMNDSALITKLFGKENSNAAIALISGIEEQERLTEAVQGTNTAMEQAEIVMESQAEKNARLKARVVDFKISLFNATGGLMGYASVLGNVSRDVGNLIPLFSGFGKMLSFVTNATKMQALWTSIVSGATKVWTAAQWLLNAAMTANPIGIVIAAVAALTAGIVWLVSKTEGWGEAWKHTVNGAKLLFTAYVSSVRFQFLTVVNGIMIGINKIKKGWYEFKTAVGIGDASENQKMINQINENTEARKKAILDAGKEVAKNALAAKDEFGKAIGSIKWKVDKEGEAQETNSGIVAPEIPGVTQNGDANSSGSGGGKTNKSETNSSIATGGTKHNYITINLNDLIGVLNIEGKNFRDSAKQMQDQTADALLRTLALATTAGN
ncbi:phage tail tape measure protein [Leeuwenhoekiella parthenopeia]|uniref:Phage tail tape measure protein n=1 Tax=Leeuwenhoekiella parthenopeia TaxID=2890320 RepID=A0ABS8GN05_9FLAO|nr:phage tail tape measure protein [Leeuwenhoekiella parthenopeia]MCC4211350.1 phage tail tape measure protein [Leeuwenhoekiella parthenopeia]